MMQLKFTRLIIFVRDVNRLKQFYINVLGFQPVEEIANEWLVLQCGGVQIALHKAGETYLHSGSRKLTIIQKQFLKLKKIYMN